MKNGLVQAIKDKNVTPISQLAFDQAAKKVARAQLTEFEQGEPRSNDAVTTNELALLTAIGEIPLYPTKHTQEDILQPNTYAPALDAPDKIETTLLCTEALEPNNFPQDSPLLQKITERLPFSNYLVCPIRLHYRKMYDTTSLMLYTSFRWLMGKTSETTRQWLQTQAPQRTSTSP